MTPPERPDDAGTSTIAGARLSSYDRRRLAWEVWLVLAITVGRSALYSLISLTRSTIEALSAGESLADRETQLNPPRDAAPLWDLLYQLLDIFFALAVVGLVVYLLWEPGSNALRRIGLDFRRFGGDLGRGALLAAAIGMPGLGLYAIGRLLGVTLQVGASPLDAAW